MSEKERVYRHLTQDFRFPSRDPLWGHIYLSDGLKSIVDSKRFRRLSGIRQLGAAHLLYPGATHTRLNHSLGVLEIAKRTLLALLRIESLDFVTLEGAKAFLCAALLHDVGHFPYAHSLKELPLIDHERLTAQLILDSELTSLVSGLDAKPEVAAAIVDLESTEHEDDELRLFRRILSGVLDPDKLDYLNRDAFFCGVSYGTQDIDFVLSKLSYDAGAGMLLDLDGVTAVENILFSKYLMYRTVYWHKTVRAATAMIKKAVYSALVDGEIRTEDLYGIDDDEFSRRFSGSSYPPFDLIAKVATRTLHAPILELSAESNPDLFERVATLDGRAVLESEIAKELSIRTGRSFTTNAVIIDIPEPISFEADLMIDTGDSLIPFPESGSVFDRAAVSRFSQALRQIRLFVDPLLRSAVDDPASLLRIGGK